MNTKSLRVLILIAALLACVCSCKGEPAAKSEEDIAKFLSDNKICTAGSPATKSIVIPSEFGEVYNNYNKLQKEQGFDLYGYRSCEATVYTYPVVSVNGEHTENTEAHVIVYEGRIIGGDVASLELDGEMRGIRS